MKRTLRNVTAVALIVLATVVDASARNEYLSYKMTSQKSFMLNVKNVVGEAQISIIDIQGRTLHQDAVDHNGQYMKVFDVSQLTEGSYLLEVMDEYKTQTITMKIGNEVELDLDNVLTDLNPILTQVDSRLTVSIYSNESEKMKVTITDGEGHVIEEATIRGEGFIGQHFDLSDLNSGRYTAVVRMDGRYFSKYIDL